MTVYAYTLGKAAIYNGYLQRTLDFAPRPKGCHVHVKLVHQDICGKVKGWYFLATEIARTGRRVPVCYSPTLPLNDLKSRIPELLWQAVAVWHQTRQTQIEGKR